jgi:hypothetical protein
MEIKINLAITPDVKIIIVAKSMQSQFLLSLIWKDYERKAPWNIGFQIITSSSIQQIETDNNIDLI